MSTDEHGFLTAKSAKNAKKQMQGMGLTQFSPVQDQFWFSGCAG
jgi:hypothetical protein